MTDEENLEIPDDILEGLKQIVAAISEAAREHFRSILDEHFTHTVRPMLIPIDPEHDASGRAAIQQILDDVNEMVDYTWFESNGRYYVELIELSSLREEFESSVLFEVLSKRGGKHIFKAIEYETWKNLDRVFEKFKPLDVLEVSLTPEWDFSVRLKGRE